MGLALCKGNSKIPDFTNAQILAVRKLYRKGLTPREMIEGIGWEYSYDSFLYRLRKLRIPTAKGRDNGGPPMFGPHVRLHESDDD
jgi:hypothetical protein